MEPTTHKQKQKGWRTREQQVQSAGEVMSNPGGADVPRKSGDAKWLMVHAKVEGGKSAGARVTGRGRS